MLFPKAPQPLKQRRYGYIDSLEILCRRPRHKSSVRQTQGINSVGLSSSSEQENVLGIQKRKRAAVYLQKCLEPSQQTSKGVQEHKAGVQVPQSYVSTQLSQQNIFQHDMLFSLPRRGGQKCTKTTYRRCLFDTGAEINMISSSALQGLGANTEASDRAICGIGGFVDLQELVILKWCFDSLSFETGTKSTYHEDVFYVLPKEQGSLFDCIVARPWIQQHLDLFLLLTKRSAAAPV